MDFSNLIQVQKRYLKAFSILIQCSRNMPLKKLNRHYHRDFILDDRSQRLLDEYIQKCMEDGNSETTINNKKMRIRNFMIDIDFKNISKDSVVLYLKFNFS